MKISEITTNDVVKYLRLDAGDYDSAELAAIMCAAEQYIVDYTGIPATSAAENAETLDNHDDFWIAYMALCQDMYDNRALVVDKGDVNRVVDAVLSMHRQNWFGGG